MTTCSERYSASQPVTLRTCAGGHSNSLAQTLASGPVNEELGALIGDDPAVIAWLQAENLDLGGRPIDLVRTDRGLREMLSYVETRMGPS